MLGREQVHGVAHDHQVGVIDDFLAGGAEVNDALGRWGGFLEGVHMGHHIVAQALFPLRRRVEIDVIDFPLHLLKRLVGDA